MTSICYAPRKDGGRLAYIHDAQKASGTGVFWLSGYRSDMAGTKAEALAGAARAASRRCFRFDYSGHGQSDGDYSDFTLSDWLEDALRMFVGFAEGDQIVVGSSMGGFIALLLALRLRDDRPQDASRIRGMVLIAPAADMTESLLWEGLNEEARSQISRCGEVRVPSRYGDDTVITRRLIEDGRNHLMLETGMDVDFPVRILHGEEDEDVPWRHGMRLYEKLRGEDVTFTLVKGGDHRLSSPRKIGLIIDTVEALFRHQDMSAARPSR